MARRVDSAEKALARLEKGERFDLILLDLMLTGMDGLDFCKIYRAEKSYPQVPIIMLTARSEEADIVSGLEFGANDYITKPFSPRVLLARIKAQLRDDQVGRGGGCCDGLAQRNRTEPRIPRGENRRQAVELTANEFSILETFLKNTGRVFTRDAIIKSLHGDGYPVTDRAVDVAIVNLRKKLGSRAKLIETVRGVGYKMSR